MREDERIWAVRQLLFDYVKSPSLRHIRDPHSVTKLAQEIVQRIDRGNAIWKKWDGQRERVLKSALGCWVPPEDMRDFLNRMPGPQLTATDVGQRLKTLEEEEGIYADEEHQVSCLALYAKEKAEGTELPHRRPRDHIDREEERMRVGRERQYQQRREEERLAAEARLLSGADCTWTQIRGSLHWYCRKNGRTYRLSPGKDNKMWTLFRVNAVLDDEKGDVLGNYQRRGDATKVVAEAAYRPEARR
jgi:hypothetical protein